MAGWPVWLERGRPPAGWRFGFRAPWRQAGWCPAGVVGCWWQAWGRSGCGRHRGGRSETPRRRRGGRRDPPPLNGGQWPDRYSRSDPLSVAPFGTPPDAVGDASRGALIPHTHISSADHYHMNPAGATQIAKALERNTALVWLSLTSRPEERERARCILSPFAGQQPVPVRRTARSPPQGAGAVRAMAHTQQAPGHVPPPRPTRGEGERRAGGVGEGGAMG
jgi:hypothetical protein